MTRAWSWRPSVALALALFFCLCAPAFPVRADHIQFGLHPVDYCVRVTNVEQFPAYQFFVEIFPGGNAQRISPSDCFSVVYKASSLRFSAIRADDSTRRMIRAPPTFYPLVRVDTLDPRVAAVDMLRIVRVDTDTLEIAPESVRYTYSGGRTETLPYTIINHYPPAAGVPLWYAILVPALALLGIIQVIRRQRRMDVEAADG